MGSSQAKYEKESAERNRRELEEERRKRAEAKRLDDLLPILIKAYGLCTPFWEEGVTPAKWKYSYITVDLRIVHFGNINHNHFYDSTEEQLYASQNTYNMYDRYVRLRKYCQKYPKRYSLKSERSVHDLYLECKTHDLPTVLENRYLWHAEKAVPADLEIASTVTEEKEEGKDDFFSQPSPVATPVRMYNENDLSVAMREMKAIVPGSIDLPPKPLPWDFTLPDPETNIFFLDNPEKEDF